MILFETGTSIKTEYNAEVVIDNLLIDHYEFLLYNVTYIYKRNDDDETTKERKILKVFVDDEAHSNSSKFRMLRYKCENVMSHSELEEYFLYPRDIVCGELYFGYIIDFIPDKYVVFDEFLLQKTEFVSFSTMIDAAVNLVCAYRSIHSRGLINPVIDGGCLNFNADDGDIRIVYNEYLSEDDRTQCVDFYINKRYVAPVIVSDKTNIVNKYTDRYTMAVLLFLIFMRCHPLEGKSTFRAPILTEFERKIHYGVSPVFIADPDDDSNRPMENNKNFSIRWSVMNDEIRSLFIKTFSKKALTEVNSSELPIERIWLNALLQYRTDLIYCPHCKSQIVFEHNRPYCMKCKEEIVPNGYIGVGRYNIPIIEGVTLLEEHLNDFSSNTYNPAIVGRIITAKNATGIYGLRNESDYKWGYYNDKELMIVRSGDVVRLIKNRRININGQIIVIN